MVRSKDWKSVYSNAGFVIALGSLLIFALFPILWIVLTSFKKQGDMLSTSPLFIFEPTLKHWDSVVIQSDFLSYYKNSLIIGSGTALLVLIVGTMAAYNLARGSYKLKENLAFFILSQRMMPAVAVVLPIYILLGNARRLDRLDTLIFVNVAFNLPLAIWMIRGFIEGLSIELEEAGLVDGCSPFGAFMRISLPQMFPGLLSTVLLTFIYTINEFFFAVILSGREARPVSVAVQLFLPTGVRGTLFGEAAVASILIMLPSLLLAIFMQRYLVSGISLGALKG